MVLFFVHYQSIHRISSPPTCRAQLRLRNSSLFQRDKMQIIRFFFHSSHVKNISFGLPHNATATVWLFFHFLLWLILLVQSSKQITFVFKTIRHSSFTQHYNGHDNKWFSVSFLRILFTHLPTHIHAQISMHLSSLCHSL